MYCLALFPLASHLQALSAQLFSAHAIQVKSPRQVTSDRSQSSHGFSAEKKDVVGRGNLQIHPLAILTTELAKGTKMPKENKPRSGPPTMPNMLSAAYKHNRKPTVSHLKPKHSVSNNSSRVGIKVFSLHQKKKKSQNCIHDSLVIGDHQRLEISAFWFVSLDFLFVCFCSVPSHYVALAVLDLTIQTRLVLNSRVPVAATT